MNSMSQDDAAILGFLVVWALVTLLVILFLMVWFVVLMDNHTPLIRGLNWLLPPGVGPIRLWR